MSLMIARRADPQNEQARMLACEKRRRGSAEQFIRFKKIGTVQRMAARGSAFAAGVLIVVQRVDDPPSFSAGEPTIGRIDQIFIHSMNEQQRLFILVTPINILDGTDEVLGLHRVQYMIQEPLMVGINAIAATKLYIVRIDDDKEIHL